MTDATHIPTPDHAIPFAMEDFEQVFNLFVAAEEDLPDRMPRSTIAGKGLLALKEHFQTDANRFCSAMWRIWGLIDLIRDERLGRWVIKGNPLSGPTRIHPAVIDATAEVRLDGRGRFRAGTFLKRVEKIAAQRYPEPALPVS